MTIADTMLMDKSKQHLPNAALGQIRHLCSCFLLHPRGFFCLSLLSFFKKPKLKEVKLIIAEGCMQILLLSGRHDGALGTGVILRQELDHGQLEDQGLSRHCRQAQAEHMPFDAKLLLLLHRKGPLHLWPPQDGPE